MSDTRSLPVLLCIAAAVAAMALTPAGARAADPGLMAQWHMDGLTNGGSTAADSSGNGNDLTVVPPVKTISPGRFGAAHAFIAGGSLRRAATASLEPQRLTLLAWVKAPDVPGASRYLVMKGADAGCTGASYALETDSSGGLVFYVWNGSGLVAKSPDAGDGIWLDRAWHAVAGTYDGSTVRLYVDGKEIGNGTPAPPSISYALGGTTDLSLADATCSASEHFIGDLDEVRIYDRALSAAEIAQLHAATGNVPPELDSGPLTPPGPGPGVPPSPGPAPAAGSAARAPVAALKVSPATSLVAKGVKVDALRGTWLSGAASQAAVTGPVVSYKYDFNDDGTTDAECGADAPAAYHVFPANAKGSVKLTVTDAQGLSSSAVQSVALPKVPASAATSPSAQLKATPATLCMTQSAGADRNLPSTTDCVREIFLLNTVAVRSRSSSCFTIENYTSADYLKLLQQRSAGPRIAAAKSLTPEQIRQLAFMKYAPFVRASITGPVEVNGISVPIPADVPTSYDSGDGKAAGTFTIGRKYEMKEALLGQVVDLGELDLSHDWKFTDGITHVADVNTNQLKLGSLPFEARASLDFVRGYKSRLTFQVKLPNVFESGDGDPVTFKLTVTADNNSGWAIEKADARIPNLHLGPALVKDLYLTYQQAENSWEGGLKLFVSGEEDGYVLDLRSPEAGGAGGPGSGLGLRNGDIAHLGGDFDFGDDEIQIYAGVFLRRVRLAVSTHPLVLSGGVTLHVVKVFFVDGDGAMVFATPREPYTWPHQRNVGMDRLAGTTFTTWAFVSGGNLYLDKGGRRWDLGGGYILVKPGLVATGSRDKIDLFGVFTVEGGFNGEVNTRTGAFNLGGRMTLCAAVVLCDGVETLISSTGIAGCKEIPPLGFSVGAGYVWGGSADVFLVDCDLGPYRASIASASRAAAGSARSFRIGPGSRGTQLEVMGASAAPKVTVTAPDGRTFTTGDGAHGASGDHAYLRSPANRTTYIALKRPAAGTWTVTAQDGAAITGGRQRDALAPAALRARVAGSGAARTLTYTFTSAPGRRITFYERSASGSRQIGTARTSGGTLRFAPAVGTGAKREIEAVVSQNGLATRSSIVARFRFATPKPPAPRAVRAVRGRRTLTVSWRPSPGARRYDVTATARSGQRLFATTRRPAVRFSGLEYYLRGTVKVTPVRADGVGGRAATARFRAAG